MWRQRCHVARYDQDDYIKVEFDSSDNGLPGIQWELQPPRSNGFTDGLKA
jgi:hypothetical protein